MADYDGLKPGEILADASVAEFIKNLGLGIAEAQKALDYNSVNQLAEFTNPIEGLGGKTLLDLGLMPAFYHYQHADLSCAMQLSMRVQKNVSFGLKVSGEYKDNTSGTTHENSNETTTQNTQSTSTTTRKASVEIETASTGELVINRQSYKMAGASSAERVEQLQEKLVNDDKSKVDRVLYQLKSSKLGITTEAPASVVATPNTVAPLDNTHNVGILRIDDNSPVKYVLNNLTNLFIETVAKADLVSHVLGVVKQIRDIGFEVEHFAPDAELDRVSFDTGKHLIRSKDQVSLQILADSMKKIGFSIEIEGFADTQQYKGKDDSEVLNKQLGNNRANEVKKELVSLGVEPSSISLTDSKGDSAARAAGDSDGKDNQEYRYVALRRTSHKKHWLRIQSKGNGPKIKAEKLPDNTPGNGFIYQYVQPPLDLSGKSVTIEGNKFPYDGTAISGYKQNSAQAYATNLSHAINSKTSSKLQASVQNNIVSVSKSSDKYQLTLVTSSKEEVKIESSEGIAVTSQFTSIKHTKIAKKESGNSSVAVGATVDARYSRQFEMDVKGNSSISARLVSIPAPPEFLETVKKYLSK